MANIRQRRLFPITINGMDYPARHFGPHGILSTPSGVVVQFAFITSQTIHYDLWNHNRTLAQTMKKQADDRTRLLKRTGRWTHVRRVFTGVEGGVRYDWYGFHNGWDATTQTYEADMVRPVQERRV